MKIVIIITAVALALYLLFIVIPGIISYFLVFSRIKTVPADKVYSSHGIKPYAEKIKAATEKINGLNGEKVYINGYKNTQLSGLYIDNNSKKTVVFYHGYHSEYSVNFSVQASYLYDRGFNILFPIQRGHGDSGGKSTLGLYEKYDLICWLNLLKDKKDTEQVLIYGMSMGCSAAQYISDRLSPDFVKAVIYDCGFSSPYNQLVPYLRKRHLPSRSVIFWTRVTAKILLGEDIKKSVAENLSKSSVPALFLHGSLDTTVPLSEGKNNFDMCSAEKRMLVADGAYHTAAFLCEEEKAKKLTEDFVLSRFL